MSHPDEDDGPIDRSLIDLARPGLEPSSADKARVKRAVLGAIAGSAVASTAAGASAAAGGTAVGGTALGGGVAVAFTTKLAIGAVALASVIGVVAVSTRGPARPAAEIVSTSESPPASSVDELVIPAFGPDEVPAIDDPAVEEEPEVTVVEPSAETHLRPPTLEVDPPIDPVLDEARLLARAQEAIDRDDGHAAMAFLAEHARRFPDGQLREERFATHIHALCALGETERARRETTSFLDVFPASVHASRVRASCGGASAP